MQITAQSLWHKPIKIPQVFKKRIYTYIYICCWMNRKRFRKIFFPTEQQDLEWQNTSQEMEFGWHPRQILFFESKYNMNYLYNILILFF